jgi:hypothetical protein
MRPRHEFSHGRLTAVFKRRLIRAVRAGNARCAGEGGRITGIPSTQRAKIPLIVLIVLS